MKPLDLLKSKIWFLLLGVVLLGVSAMCSILVLHQLNNTMKLRQKAFKVQSKIDDLDQYVKEWLLLNLAYEKNPNNKELYVKSELVKNRTTDLFEEIKIRLANDKESYERLLNLELEWRKIKEDFPGHNVLDYFSFETRQLEKAQLDKIGIQSPLIDSNFRLIYLLSTILLILSMFVISAALYFYRKEQKIKNKLIDQLRVSKDQAQASSRLKSQILATVSHEIRTPLNGIIGMCDILNKLEDLSPSVHNKIQVINSSGQTLNHIVQDILNFSKVEAGKVAANTADFDLHKTCHDVVETLRFQANEKNISLHFEYQTDLNYHFKGDKDLISQILYNLIGNSIKFTNEGYVTLKIDRAGQDKIALHIIDTGIGMEKESLSRIFEPFFQVQSSLVSEKGTGLGLAICRRLANIMNGKIRATSTKDEGSHFRVTLPLKAIETPLSEGLQKNQQETNEEQTYFNDLNALVAEDNPTNQIIITNMLDILKIKHTVANNGAQAIKILSDPNKNFDCIFMDCQMPEIDGYEATQKIRKQGIKTKIIAMTANAASENIEQCNEIGMDDFLSKPINLQNLAEILEKHFKEHSIVEKKSQKKTSDKSNDASAQIQTSDTSTQSNQKAEDSTDLFEFQDNIKITLDRLAAETNKAVVSQIVTAFQKSLDEIQTELDSNIDNLEQIQKIGHKYKSSSKLIGAQAFSDLCLQIEKSKDLKSAQNNIERLKELIPNVKKYIDSLHRA